MEGLSLTVWDTEQNAYGMADRFGPGSSQPQAHRLFDARFGRWRLPREVGGGAGLCVVPIAGDAPGCARSLFGGGATID